MMKQMFKAMPNNPVTRITTTVTADATTIQVREGDVKNYLQPGTNTFLVETTDAINEDNARYGGAMQFELIVTGYLRG